MESVELLLDLEAREVDRRRDPAPHARRRLHACRSRADAGGRQATASGCSFDAEALERAIRDTDIEAHGLREKMAVLAVVVATTGAAAGSAQAMPSREGRAAAPAATVARRDIAGRLDERVCPVTEGAPATRANPSEAAAASARRARRDLQSRRGSSPATAGDCPASHHAAPPVVTDPARDLPSDSARASQVPPLAHGVAATGSSSVDSSTFVVVGGIALALLGAAFAAAAANRRTPKPT